MKEKLTQAFTEACKNIYEIDAQIDLARPDAQFGDFATNVALQLAKKLNSNPRDVAAKLAEAVRQIMPDEIKGISVAGPGFINITLSDNSLCEMTGEQQNKLLLGKKVLVEYSDPNPFKPLHAGHLYTTLVGDMIARLVENAGADTIRLNYGGDVGLHAGKSMWAIIKYLGGEKPEELNRIPENDRPAWLGARYVEGNNAYEDDESAKKEIIIVNKKVYQVHQNDDHSSNFAQIYWTCRQWSYDYFAELYEQLQVVPFDRFIPESEVTPLGLRTVEEQLEKDVFTKSDGAVIFDGEKFGLHSRVFINSEGLPTYEAKDVGLSLAKWQDYQFDESIIITANEQAQYMKVVLAAINQFAPEPANRTRHLTHGVVKLQGGVKMSSRKGNVVTALEILEAARRAGEASGTNPDEQTILAAVKYAFAKVRIGGDIVYDPTESIALEGNSGPYLQYAHARARSILAKIDKPSEENLDELQPEERKLLRKISEFGEIINKATAELMPHYICTYLYELAQEFNRFYENNRVLGDSRQVIRILLVQKYADGLKSGLSLLGIHAPNKM